MGNVNAIDILLSKTPMRQQDVAKRLGTTRTTLNNYRERPGNIPASVLKKIAALSGCSYEELLGPVNKPTAPQLNKIYSELTDAINGKITRARIQMDMIKQISSKENLDTLEREKDFVCSKIEKVLKRGERECSKPTVCIMGDIGVGKTSFANALLGVDLLPKGVAALPVMIPIIMHHISDKPEIVSFPNNAIILGHKVEANDAERADISIDLSSRSTQILIPVDYRSVIASLDQAVDIYNKSEGITLDAIHIYSDRPILENITLIDTFGFNMLEEDKLSKLVCFALKCDLVIYLSPVSKFISSTDRSILRRIIKVKNDLSSIMIIASKADMVAANEKNGLCINGLQRLCGSLSSTDTQSQDIECDIELLKKLTCPYDVFNDWYSEHFNERFVESIRTITKKKENMAMIAMSNSATETIDELEGTIQQNQACSEIDSQNKIKQKIDIDHFNREINVLRVKTEKSIKHLIQNYKRASRDYFCDEYHRIISQDYLIKEMHSEAHAAQNSSASLSEFAEYISDSLNDCAAKSIMKCTESFSVELKKRIQDFEQQVDEIVDKETGLDESQITGLKNIFMAKLDTAKKPGALSFLREKIKSEEKSSHSRSAEQVLHYTNPIIKVSRGIALATEAATGLIFMTPAMAGLLPFMGVGMSFMGTKKIVESSSLSGNWDNRFAKKIIEAYESDRVLDRTLDAISNYWNDTHQTIHNCFTEAIAQQGRQIEDILVKSKVMNTKDMIHEEIQVNIIYSTAINICSQLAKCEEPKNIMQE